jgi:hypothetical protein
MNIETVVHRRGLSSDKCNEEVLQIPFQQQVVWLCRRKFRPWF